MARLALSRVARQRMVGSAITTTTPEPRLDKIQGDLYRESQSDKVLSCMSSSLESGLHSVVLRTSQFLLFFLAVSRPDSGNCHERDGSFGRTDRVVRLWMYSDPCTDNSTLYARALFSRCARSHARCDLSFGSRA